MGAKRKQGEGGSPEASSSKKSKTEAEGDAGRAWYAEALRFKALSETRDGTDVAKATTKDDQAWVEKMALHLAHSPQFIELMKSPVPADQINVGFWFLAAVHLQGRWKRYSGASAFSNFYTAWWNKKFKGAVIDRASELLLEIVDNAHTAIYNLRAPLPANDAKTSEKREKLFKLHTNRQRLIEGIQALTSTQHALARELQNAIAESVAKAKAAGSKDAAESSNRDKITNELSLLDKVKQDFRTALAKSEVDDEGVAYLDKMLQSVPEEGDHSCLWWLDPSSSTGVTSSSAPTVAPSAKGKEQLAEEAVAPAALVQPITEVQKKLREKHNFTPDYVGNVTDVQLNKEVFQVNSTTKKADAEKVQKVKETTEPVFLDDATMVEYDKACAQWFKSESSQFQTSTFVITFREFEAVTERPEPCKKAKKNAAIWRWQPTQHLNVVKDNMWHVRSLVKDMVDAELLRPDQAGEQSKREQLQRSLRRMWALLAVAYGCCGEVGLLCTLMDRLLEDLASLFEGHTDPKMETTSMQKIAQQIQDFEVKKVTTAFTNPNKSSKFMDAAELTGDAEVLERHFRVRMAFSEVARFYRGAIMLAISKVSSTYHHTTKDQKQIWYSELLKMCETCGHPSCKQQIQVKRMDWGASTQTKAKGKGKGKAKATAAEGGDDGQPAGKEKWTVSIAVKDARIGFPDERAHLSKNRPNAYPCLSAVLANIKFNVALGVFFHYFTHLYHPACRPFRGKHSLIEDEDLA